MTDVPKGPFRAPSRGDRHEPTHVEAAEMLGGGLGELSVMYDRLMSVIAARSEAKVVQVHEGEEP
jgi:hypothetical protein